MPQSHLRCLNYVVVKDIVLDLCVYVRLCVCACVCVRLCERERTNGVVDLLKGAFLQHLCRLQLIIISDYIRGN